MASKEINSLLSDQEVHLSNDKSRHSLSLNRHLTRRAAAIVLTSALYLADGTAPPNAEAASTPTSTPTSVPKEAVKIDGLSITIDEQTIDRWVPRVGAFGSLLSGLGLFATTYALFQLRREARAAEVSARATVDAARAAEYAAIRAEYTSRISNYQNLMAMGNSINATFLEHPELYNQLFETPHVGPESIKRTSDQQKDTQVLATALRFADYFELILDLGEAIPQDLRNSWYRYMRTCLKNSESLRDLVRNTDWYGASIKELCADVQDDIDREKNLAQRGHRFLRVKRLLPL